MLSVKVLTAKASIGDPVKNLRGEELARIKDILEEGELFAVLSFNRGEKEFAVPYSALSLVGEEGYFLLPVEKSVLELCVEKQSFQGRIYYKLSH